MIVTIDETGDFSPKSNYYHFISAVHIQNTSGKDNLVLERFTKWENSLPKSLKNHKGEIKSSKLNEEQLNNFVNEVLYINPEIVISTIRFNPIENPYQIVNKHKFMQQLGINEGILLFTKLNRPRIVKTIRDFSFWFRKLSYTQFIKIELLGILIYKSFKNAIGSSLAWDLDDELMDLKYIIDEMFLKGKQQNVFWLEILRNQFYSESVKDPFPFLIEWEENGSPFVNKYLNDEGILNFKDLFVNNCQFKKSHDTYEIRIADAVNTILSRYFNFNQCRSHFEKLVDLIIPKGLIEHIILKDFDVEKAIGKNPFNPWENKEEFKLRMNNLNKKVT